MIEKLIIIILIAKISYAAESNPCAFRSGAHFARNMRGCSWYFVCNDNNEVVRENRCASGFFFNYFDQMCDYRDRVNCDLDDRWRNVTCPANKGFNVIPHPITCLKYTVCFDGIQNDRSCAPGLHFSYYDNECVDPFYADCSLDYELCELSRETGLPQYVRNPRDCSSYFLCVGENAVAQNCAPGTHFVLSKGYCLPIDQANCTSELPDDNPRIPDRVVIDCEGETGNIPHPDACEFYFFCIENRSYLQACGENLIFDKNTRRCETADRAQCILDIVTEPTTTTEEGSGAEDDKFFIFEKIHDEKFKEIEETANDEDESPETEGFIRIQQ